MGWTMALGCLCFTLTNQHRWKQELQPTCELGFHHNYRNFAIVDLHLCSYVLNSCFKHRYKLHRSVWTPTSSLLLQRALQPALKIQKCTFPLYIFDRLPVQERGAFRVLLGLKVKAVCKECSNMLPSPTYFLQGPVNLNLVSFCVISPVFEEVLLPVILPVLCPMKNVFFSAL